MIPVQGRPRRLPRGGPGDTLHAPHSMPTTPASRRLLLVRHGHYDRVGDLGDEKWPLSALGRKQAIRTGRRIRAVLQGADSKLEGLFSSPWPRALETAEIVAREVGIETIRVKPYLHEVVPLVRANPAGTGYPHGIPPTTDEEMAQMQDQMDRLLKRFLRRPTSASVAVVCTHGNLIRYVVAEVFGAPWDAWMKMEVSHAGITEVRVYRTGSVALAGFNETGHLPPPLITAI